MTIIAWIETVILSGDFTGEKTLPAPGFEPTNFLTESLFAAAVPILTVVGLLVLSPQSGPFQVASSLGAV